MTSGKSHRHPGAVDSDTGPLNLLADGSARESPGISDRLRSSYLKLISTSWLTSACLHVIVLLLIGRLVLPVLPSPPIQTLVLGAATEPIETIEDFEQLTMQPTDLPSTNPAADIAIQTDLLIDEPQPSVAVEMAVPATAEPVVNIADTITDITSPAAGTAAAISARSNMKASQLRQAGGNAGSEAAVRESLLWLASHQLPTGGWTLRNDRVPGCDCRNSGAVADGPYDAPFGATGLALLPFLGAGQTHLSGKYQQQITAGLAYLVDNIELTGTRGKLYDRGNYYSHAICTIVLCEAYAMTQDPALAAPAQSLVDQIVYAQDPLGGGWRYTDRQPGDTSVTGWQFMALKSAQLAGLHFPPEVIEKAGRFLDTMAVNSGAFAAQDCVVVGVKASQVTVEVRPPDRPAFRVNYIDVDTRRTQLRVGQPIAAGALIAPMAADQLASADGWKYRYSLATDVTEDTKIIAPRKPTAALSAVGLLCRMYYGWDEDHPLLQQGLNYLSDQGPSVDQPNMYYNYYATQVMRHQSDVARWSAWNEQLRDFLIASQQTSGHERGSWHFGNHHHGDDHGGRLYITALASMILEVYYRHLPLYRDRAAASFLD